MKTVFCSGTFDLLHPGHITFLKRAAQYGDLYVGIGNDYSVEKWKGRTPVFNQDERLYMIRAVRYVKDAFITTGDGNCDFIPDLVDNFFIPAIMIVNNDQDSECKRNFCKHQGIEYIVLERTPEPGFSARSTSELRKLLAI